MRSRQILSVFLVAILVSILVGCNPPPPEADRQSVLDTIDVTRRLIDLQPVPTDIQASMERHNIIRRSYWINGMRERALSLPNPIANPPLGYVILFAPNGGVIGRFLVEGKVTSLNYSLVPYSEYWERAFGDSAASRRNRWIANPGGVFGTNNSGIFWFTPEGKYMEWTGVYLFTDVPFAIDDPILHIERVDQ